MNFPDLPDPPYIAVVFANQRTTIEDNEYGLTAQRMGELAAQQPGFLGMNSTRDANGFGITVSYWADQESAKQWRQQAEHQLAQQSGREKWYQRYQIQTCKVESGYDVIPNSEGS